ncbi:spore germination protein [Brevibacillus nitrificans]|uniref:spore germination protein n=1 Tax=Brevibacillus nitrificans TaxID=651560 RepID=UPI002628B46C|nr:spore germination protein [Brevibacillus nitrificans]
MEQIKIKSSLDENISIVQSRLGDSDDLVIRRIQFGNERNLRAALFYIDGMVDTASIQNFLLETLMIDLPKTMLSWELDRSDSVLRFLKESIMTVGDIQEVRDVDSQFTFLLSGYCVFLLDGYDEGFSLGLIGWEERSVTEPSGETVIRGPREGFTENLRTNTSMIRRRIKDPRLWIEIRRIGNLTHTDVAIAYIKGIANDKVVEEVRRRLDRICMDSILETGYIEELIQDETFTPFPTMNNTERPDVATAELIEGRVVILVDGTPFVLVAPALFVSFFQAAEDYYQRADISTLLRGLRYVSFFIALLGPSLYIAITTFHQEMLPTQLLISLAAQREGVPFPAFFEAMLMEVTFEILREAGVRMPKAIGQAVSIVGTLVIGTAAVDAGIVSAAMVIVVSITAIASFVMPAFNMSIAVRMLRFPLMALAASFGIFGVIVGLLLLVLHMCSLRSFGVPYMSPLAPMNIPDQKDTLLRLPHWAMKTRPRLIGQKNIVRAQNSPTKKPERRGNQ